MMGKPQEKLHVVHMRCHQCNRFHYNTWNLGTIVVITTLYTNDPLEECTTQSLSTIRTPFGLNYAPTILECLRLLNTPRYPHNTEQLEQIQGEDNGMEALELDTPTGTISIPESLPSLETMPSNLSIYGRVPIDYTPMQDLSIDIKHMPMAFGGYQYLLVIRCNHTNFTIVTPLRSRDVQYVAEALIYRVIYLSGPPRQIICDEVAKFTSHIVQAILHMLNCKLKVIRPYNHGSSKVERQIKTISDIIVTYSGTYHMNHIKKGSACTPQAHLMTMKKHLKILC